jgi:c-di-GMP-binding flagellar brake protein YcgR
MNLEEGATVCLSAIGSPDKGVAALVTEVSLVRAQLRPVLATLPLPFEAEQQVRIDHWEEDVVHTWEGVVGEITNNGGQFVSVLLGGNQTTIERRVSSRVRRTIPFSFTVTDAAERSLIGQQYHHAKTKDISAGGIKFETSLPLQTGDRLDVELLASTTEPIGTIGLVARSEKPAEADTNSISLQFLRSEGQDEVSLLDFLASISSASSKDKRQFKRWQVSLPCTVFRDADLIRGTITNISYGGALIAQVSSVPPEGAKVFLELGTAGNQILLNGQITAIVIHHIEDVVEQGEAGAFGIEFRDTPEEIQEKLSRVLSELD